MINELVDWNIGQIDSWDMGQIDRLMSILIEAKHQKTIEQIKNNK